MKCKLLILLVVLTLLITPVIAGCQQSAEPEPISESGELPEEVAQQFNLQFATFWPAMDFQVTEGHEAWAKEISARVAAETPHTVNFQFHPGGALLGAVEIYEGVAAGAADLGTTCPSYTAGVFPLTEAFELPGYTNSNALAASLTIHEAWKRNSLLQNEYEDVKVMFFWATGPGDFITNTPVRTLDDLSGQQIRATGGTVQSVEALGAISVGLPMSESYMALDSGIVNGILGPTDTLQGFRLAEVTGYITKTPFIYNIVFMKVMNWDTWNSLPPSVQQIFEEVNEKYVTEYGKLRTDYTVEGQKYAVEEYGHEVFDLDEEEQAIWIEKLEPMVQAWIDKADSQGLPGQEIVDLVRELDAKHSAEYGGYGE